MLYLSTGYRGFESLLLRSGSAVFAGRTQWQGNEPGATPALTTPTSTPTRPEYPLARHECRMRNRVFVSTALQVVVAFSVQYGLSQPESIITFTPMQSAGYGPRRIDLFHAIRCIEAKAAPHAIGESGWLKAFGLEAYAPRSRGIPRGFRGRYSPTSKALGDTSSRPPGTVVEVDHAAGEAAFIQQFELQATGL